MNENKPLSPDSAGFEPVAFAEAEKGVVFALVGTVASSKRCASVMAACEASALTDLVVIGCRRADRMRAEGKSSDLPMREIIAEVSAALRVSDRVAERLLGEALTLTTSFPQTHAALGDGRISPSHVRTIVQAGLPIADDEARAGYEQKVLRVAEVESAGRLKPIAEILAAKANPETIDARHQRARRDREVHVVDADDGMAILTAYLPATLAYGIRDRLTSMAKKLQQDEAAAIKAAAVGDGVLPGMAAVGAGSNVDVDAEADGVLAGMVDVNTAVTTVDEAASPGATAPEADAETEPPRSLDELRADLLADLLLSGAPSGHGDGLDDVRGYVQVTVPVLTAAGLSGEPAILAGRGPIDAATARRIAGNEPGWDRVMTHPVSNEVLAVDRCRPSAQLRRFLRIRDQHCRFPNCRIPAWRNDADHTLDAAKGGLTRDDNLAFLCEPHHVVKHGTEWRVQQLSRGRLEWTSPTGRVYVDTPERTLLFTADGDPPPF